MSITICNNNDNASPTMHDAYNEKWEFVENYDCVAEKHHWLHDTGEQGITWSVGGPHIVDKRSIRGLMNDGIMGYYKLRQKPLKQEFVGGEVIEETPSPRVAGIMAGVVVKQNQMPPKKQKRVSMRQTAGEPSCKKVLFVDSDSDSDDDGEEEVIKPWDSQPTRDLLISMVKIWGERRAKPETHTAFMLLGDFGGDGDKEMSSSKGTPMTLARLKVAQQFCDAFGDKMGCKRKLQFIDMTSTRPSVLTSGLGRIDMMMAVHEDDVESMDASQIDGKLVNAEVYYADKGKLEWTEVFITSHKAWLGLDAEYNYQREVAAREAAFETTEEGHQRWKRKRDGPHREADHQYNMPHLRGYASADMPTAEWVESLTALGITNPKSPSKLKSAMYDLTTFLFTGPYIQMVVEYNPFTGEGRHRPAGSRIGYAGRVGIRCANAMKMDQVVKMFDRNRGWGCASGDKLEFIGFDFKKKSSKTEPQKKQKKQKVTQVVSDAIPKPIASQSI